MTIYATLAQNAHGAVLGDEDGTLRCVLAPVLADLSFDPSAEFVTYEPATARHLEEDPMGYPRREEFREVVVQALGLSVKTAFCTLERKWYVLLPDDAVTHTTVVYNAPDAPCAPDAHGAPRVLRVDKRRERLTFRDEAGVLIVTVEQREELSASESPHRYDVTSIARRLQHVNFFLLDRRAADMRGSTARRSVWMLWMGMHRDKFWLAALSGVYYALRYLWGYFWVFGRSADTRG
jgi:hypothetical protein